jgi:hypothetical protein
MLYFKLLKYYKSVLLSKHRGQIIEEIEHKTIKLIDSTIVSLCLSLFSWAKYRTAKGGLKIHTCWDDALMLPDLINITEAAIADIKGLPQRIFPTGTIIVEDRGYFDFDLMRARTEADNWFVTRLKNTTVLEVIATRPIPDDINHLCILSDEEIQLTGTKAVETGVEVFAFRRVRVYHKRKDRFIELITNNFEWSAATISALYKKRWDIELFFKAMKQNLQIKTFVGTSENAVRSQIYVALICYLLLELMRRNTCKSAHAFSNFVEKIRICLCHYLSIDRVCNHVCQGAKSVKAVQSEDLFSGNIRGAPNKNDTLRLQFP